MNWDTWIALHQKELQHIAGYEEMFVDRVLSRIPNLRPTDVIPQYHFVDDTGKNRYIDFMIINPSMGWLLPIELDGYAKMVGNGDDYARFQDFLERQNAIIKRYGILLRYTNKDMLKRNWYIITEITQVLLNQLTLSVNNNTIELRKSIKTSTPIKTTPPVSDRHWIIELLCLPIRCIKLLGKATGIIGDTINHATHELNKSLDEVQENIYYNLARQELEEENLLPKRDLTNMRHSETEKQLIRLRVSEIKERKRLTGSIIKRKK